jgi:hypothetical protein
MPITDKLFGKERTEWSLGIYLFERSADETIYLRVLIGVFFSSLVAIDLLVAGLGSGVFLFIWNGGPFLYDKPNKCN